MIVSFYSYKGGVGRSQLCANIATYLFRYKKKRVLLWDWDFEAPGLHYFFGKKTNEIQRMGTLELLEQYVETMRKNPKVGIENLQFIAPEYITNLRTDSIGNGCIDLLTAGNYGDNFSFRSANFDWFEFYSMLDGIAYIELLKTYISSMDYDYILIDSRTGIADYSGICNTQLPDLNVMVIAPTMQNYDGCESIIEKITNSEYLTIKNRKPRILPILSRIDLSGPEYDKWVNSFAEKFQHLILNLDEKLDLEFLREVFADVFFKDTFLPYTSAISAGENIFTEEKQISKTNFNRPFLNIAEYIEEINSSKRIDFYKRIDETTWAEYLKATDGNKRKSSIANFQIGIKQDSPSEQLRYFKAAIEADPTHEQLLIKFKERSLSKMIDDSIKEFDLHSADYQLSKLNNSSWLRRHALKLVVVGSVIFSLYTIIYTPKSNNDKFTDITPIDSTKKVLANLSRYNSSYFNPPVTNGSKYFDTIRSQGKPIGVDFSFGSTIYDRSKLKQLGMSFVLIKASDGNRSDANFKNSWYIAKTAVFLRGAYHTYNPKTADDQQAKNYIESLKLSPGDLPPIIDLRNVSITTMKSDSNILRFLTRINIFYGVKPIVLADNAFLSASDKEFKSRYHYWVSQPNSNSLRPEINFRSNRWLFWQFSNTEPIDGISTPKGSKKPNFYDVGVNQFNGTNEELKNIRIQASSGRKALEKAYSFLYEKNLEPYGVEKRPLLGDEPPSHPNKRINLKKFQSEKPYNLTFNWNVELINHSFSELNNKRYYGKSMKGLLDTLTKQNYVRRDRKNLQIGDIVFYDLDHTRDEVQACGIVFNFNREYIYAVEAGDGYGKKKLRTVERSRDDIKAYARIP